MLFVQEQQKKRICLLVPNCESPLCQDEYLKTYHTKFIYYKLYLYLLLKEA